MKKLACALATAATLVGGSLAASQGAEARPYRHYAAPGYYGVAAYPRRGYYGYTSWLSAQRRCRRGGRRGRRLARRRPGGSAAPAYAYPLRPTPIGACLRLSGACYGY